MDQISYEPRLRLIAIAAALAWGSGGAHAQASGATVVHGQASFSSQGNQLTITTANGAGTRHSAIDWRAFSVPQGSITRFNQPDAASTSINRVLGNDPSQILGTLSSNGRLVLVNPAGITVGQGAAVDTAGFTASTLRLLDADALAGRLRFAGGLPGATLRVDGSVVAQVGDVVLISSSVAVGANALVRAPDGAVVLAAGQAVEVTGRGLEGIRMEVVAPSDSAVNLGTLHGDAVGMFAANLRHSGLIRAVGAELDGNKLRLVASRSSQVDGEIRTGLTLVLATRLSDKGKDDKDQEDKDKADKDKAEREKEEKDKAERAKADKDKADKQAGSNSGNNPDGENGGAGNSTATAPSPAPAAPASTPAPAPVPTSNISAQTPVPAPAAAPAAAPLPAPPPEQAAAPAPAPAPTPGGVTITLTGNTAPALPANIPVQAGIEAARQQEKQVISFLTEPVAPAAAAAVDPRKKRQQDAAAKDALQCSP